MERMMGEKEWKMHDEWLRKEELARYEQSVCTPTTVPKLSGVPDRKQESTPLGVSGVDVVVRESELLVCAERAPATAQ